MIRDWKGRENRSRPRAPQRSARTRFAAGRAHQLIIERPKCRAGFALARTTGGHHALTINTVTPLLETGITLAILPGITPAINSRRFIHNLKMIGEEGLVCFSGTGWRWWLFRRLSLR